jgi:hypothetical protein
MARINLFTTVDGKGNLVPTTGTFSLGRKVAKDAPETIIFTSNYSKGTAETPLIYAPDDTIYVNPVGYLSMSTTLVGEKLRLQDSSKAIKASQEEKRSYVASKFRSEV